MTQSERLLFLIKTLLAERNDGSTVSIPIDESERFNLFRSLVNIREPKLADTEFLTVQDDYLRALTAEKGITDANSIVPIRGKLCVWQGDITTLRADAIVNAANSQMLGCWVPCHRCIDNAIHTFAGVQLRAECDALMKAKGHDEPVGQAEVTNAYNLPARFIIHTVGPYIANGIPTAAERAQLASCYTNCLAAADAHHLHSLAFCCISTGEFRFPNRDGAEIAVNTVQTYLASHTSSALEKIIFNVFKDTDRTIYEEILSQ